MSRLHQMRLSLTRRGLVGILFRTFPIARIIVTFVTFVMMSEFSWCQDFSVQRGVSSIQEILYLMNQVPAGGKLIQKALAIWKAEKIDDLADHVKWAESSRTDTVLTRKFNPKNGKEDRVRQVTIYLKKNQESKDTILDLAHELVHATSQPSFDPYDPGLTAGKYINAAIEGEGGEVQAVMSECEVGLQLAEKVGLSVDRCRNYLSSATFHVGHAGNLPTKNVLSQDRIRKDFYRVGNWYFEVVQALGNEVSLFPLLNREVPQLVSSTGHSPYPVALLREFDEITEMACQNSRKRMTTVASPEVASSSLNNLDHATVSQLPLASLKSHAQDDVMVFMQRRCKNKNFHP